MEVNTYLLFIFIEFLNTILDLLAVWLGLNVCANTNKKCYFFRVPAALEKQLFSLLTIYYDVFDGFLSTVGN